MIFILFALAVAPGLAIAIFVYEKDKLDREPLHLLVKSFFLGALSIFPASFLEGVFEGFGFKQTVELTTTLQYALTVGFSEELSKFLILILFFYRRKEFNEPFDGITYGVMIAMGFATLENVFYVVEGGLGVALIRMFTAVPAHATFGVLMGFFVGMAKFQHRRHSFKMPLSPHGRRGVPHGDARPVRLLPLHAQHSAAGHRAPGGPGGGHRVFPVGHPAAQPQLPLQPPRVAPPRRRKEIFKG
jgi:RsiW-degrading membrane proteinase PrsW (M82 family)